MGDAVALLPPGAGSQVVYAGGNPNFDETTGCYKSAVGAPADSCVNPPAAGVLGPAPLVTAGVPQQSPDSLPKKLFFWPATNLVCPLLPQDAGGINFCNNGLGLGYAMVAGAAWLAVAYVG